MDFTFSEDQLDFRNAAKDVLAGECTVEHLRGMVEGGTCFSLERWATLAGLGLNGIMVPEGEGGLGLGAVDFVLIAEECGYACLPEPLVETAAIAVPLLQAIGGQEKRLARIAIGSLAVSVATHGFLASAPIDMLALTFDGGAIYLAENPTGLSETTSIDPLRALVIAAPLGDAVLSGADAVAAWQETVNRANLFGAAQLVGLARRMVDMAVDYAKERQQFGKPIGSFQAIKHHLATVMVQLEFVKPLIARAACSLEADHKHAGLHVSHAKLKAADAAMLASETAHQVHGAMGYTYEVDLHLWMKRALALGSDMNTHENSIDAALIGPSATIVAGAGMTFSEGY